MKKVLLCVIAFMTLVSSSAWAQFPGEYRGYPDRRGPPPVNYYERDPYAEHRRGPPPPIEKYRDHRPGREMDRRGPPRPRVCITSRGSCPADPRSFTGENCSCAIPGFGMKRGNVR